jgi:hypothetical protein
MIELVLGTVLIATALYVIVRFGKGENGFVRRTSRGAFMRDLNKAMEQSQRSRNL